MCVCVCCFQQAATADQPLIPRQDRRLHVRDVQAEQNFLASMQAAAAQRLLNLYGRIAEAVIEREGRRTGAASKQQILSKCRELRQRDAVAEQSFLASVQVDLQKTEDVFTNMENSLIQRGMLPPLAACHRREAFRASAAYLRRPSLYLGQYSNEDQALDAWCAQRKAQRVNKLREAVSDCYQISAH